MWDSVSLVCLTHCRVLIIYSHFYSLAWVLCDILSVYIRHVQWMCFWYEIYIIDVLKKHSSVQCYVCLDSQICSVGCVNRVTSWFKHAVLGTHLSCQSLNSQQVHSIPIQPPSPRIVLEISLCFFFWQAYKIILFSCSGYHCLCVCVCVWVGGWVGVGVGPPWRINLMTHHTMSECFYHGATSRSYIY